MIRITTPFAEVAVAISDLSKQQRNALAELLGLSSAKAKAFEKLAGFKPFQKIRKSELQARCPHKVSYGLMTVHLTDLTEQPPAVVEEITKLLPEATCSARRHTLSVYCKDCYAYYALSKVSVLVQVIVEGVPFNKLLEVEEEL